MKQYSLAINSILNLIKTLMGLIFPLITLPYASRVLLADGIGKINYVMSIISYFQMVASLGISTYAITEGAKKRDNKDELNSFVTEMFSISLITTLLSYILLIFTIKKAIFNGYENLLLISSISIAFNTLSMDWLYSILEEYKYITIRSIAFQTISLFLLFILVKKPDDLPNYLILTIISSVGAGVLNFIYSLKFIQLFAKPVNSRNLVSHIKPICIIFGISVSSTIYMNSDIIMLGYIKGSAAVGYYSVAVKIIQVIVSLIVSISTVLLPRLSYYVKHGQNDEFTRVTNSVINIMLMAIIPCMIGFFCLAESSVRLVFGDTFSPAVTPLKLLIPNLFLSPFNNFMAYQILMPHRKEKLSFLATTMGASLNIILNLYLIPRYSYNGAAFTTLIAEFVVFLFCILCTNQYMSWLRGLYNMWQYIMAALIIIPINFFVNQLRIYSVFKIICLIVVSSILYFLILLFLKNPFILKGWKIVKSKF